MSTKRAQFQVLVIPFFRDRDHSRLRYCVLKRADDGYWQWIAGGGEGDESPVEAARRETEEETGFRGQLYALSTKAYVPVDVFKDHVQWPPDLYVIPEYAFAMESPDLVAVMAYEHSEFKWVEYDEAVAMLHWQSNQVALWELARRLQRSDLHQVD
jgi:dATP pyrophosphohydrolase